MKNIISSNKLKKLEDVSIYSLSDTCPICGIYTPDGNVCIECQKKYGMYSPKTLYID